MSSNFAIVIGVNDYVEPARQGLRTLSGAIADAEAVHQWLIDEGEVLPENCHLIRSQRNPLNPIKNDVDRAIVNIIREVRDNLNSDANRLYFYFAGHGMSVERDQENNGLCMADWEELMKDVASLSSSEYKRKFINEGLFKEVVIWLDCCRNTKLFFTPQGGPAIVPLGPNIEPRWYIAYATQFQNEAFEVTSASNNETRGVFTSVLLEGLSGAASDSGSRPVTDRELSDYLAYHVPIRAQDSGYSQVPQMQSNTNKYNPIIF